MDTGAVKEKARELCQAEEQDQLARFEAQLKSLLNPPYNWLFSNMAHLEEGVKFLSDLRADILSMLSSDKSLERDQR